MELPNQTGHLVLLVLETKSDGALNLNGMSVSVKSLKFIQFGWDILYHISASLRLIKKV